jgi:ferric-dicitrate binding protein FerR (iron transport regulator)
MKDINDILAKHFSGETNPEEAKLVADWRRENEVEYNALESAWKETDLSLLKGIEFKSFDSKAAWQKVDTRLVDHKEVKIIKLNFYKKVAAACAILLVGLAGFWFINKGNGFDSISNTASTPKEISLPDGSTVWLASNSTLNYKTDFENERSLRLQGEAFFEVAPDKAHPFIISTNHGDVEVLGTGFNVDATDKSTLVTVSHGRVALRNENGNQVELTAGESANSSAGSLSEVEAATPNYESWKSGEFNFDNTPVNEVIELLTKHYGKEIELTDTKLGEETLTGMFVNQPIEDIIEVIVLTCDVSAEYGEDTIRLR